MTLCLPSHQVLAETLQGERLHQVHLHRVLQLPRMTLVLTCQTIRPQAFQVAQTCPFPATTRKGTTNHAPMIAERPEIPGMPENLGTRENLVRAVIHETSVSLKNITTHEITGPKMLSSTTEVVSIPTDDSMTVVNLIAQKSRLAMAQRGIDHHEKVGVRRTRKSQRRIQWHPQRQNHPQPLKSLQ